MNPIEAAVSTACLFLGGIALILLVITFFEALADKWRES